MTIIERHQKPLLGKFLIRSTLIIETGLHIGGSGENLDIGGLDKPVIRDPITQQPYIPGSSIKGKLRSILERWFNKPLNRSGGSGTYRYESDDLEDGYSIINNNQYIAFQGAANCPLSRVFGSTGNSCLIKQTLANEQDLEINETREIEGESYSKIKGRNAPARLIVRDAHLQPESARKLNNVDTGLFMTEWKFENGIDRITSAANPRQLERVPAGSQFNFELSYTVEREDQVVEDLQNIAIALAILEDDALGGHGSRGYGKVKFQNFNFTYRDINKYRQIVRDDSGDAAEPLILENTSELLANFNDVQNLITGN
mgnify:CR=1 FL=1